MKLNGMSVVAGIPFLLYNASKNKYCKGNKTMIEQLPKAFLERMKEMLGEEYDAFLKRRIFKTVSISSNPGSVDKEWILL